VPSVKSVVVNCVFQEASSGSRESIMIKRNSIWQRCFSSRPRPAWRRLAHGRRPCRSKSSAINLLDSSEHPVRLRGVNSRRSGVVRGWCGVISSRRSRWRSASGGPISSAFRSRRTGGSAKRPTSRMEARAIARSLRQAVDFCAAHDTYIILDLHWSDAGEWGRNIGQHDLPDRNRRLVLEGFRRGLPGPPARALSIWYNEPSNINWDQVVQGGRPP